MITMIITCNECSKDSTDTYSIDNLECGKCGSNDVGIQDEV
jgi:DNA-directed RNA polymerase subunit RPC12/RpoP